MLNIKGILLPVDFPDASLSVIHQAATIARRFHSEILMLHVATPRKFSSETVAKARDLSGGKLLKEILREAAKRSDYSLGAALEGITIRCVLGEGDPAQAILQIAKREKVDLIMMASQGETFYRFLLSSVYLKVSKGSECPIWTGAHVEETEAREFALRKIMCAVDLGPRSPEIVKWAEQLAVAFGTQLLLAHVTPGVEFWGPGGSYVNQEWKEALVSDAARRMAELQKEMGTNAEVFIGSGDVPKVLKAAAEQANVDLLVTGCQPYGGHLRTHGYSIISVMPIPVLNI
jgi:nucleotide-binding universal stress UspA family protein